MYCAGAAKADVSKNVSPRTLLRQFGLSRYGATELERTVTHERYRELAIGRDDDVFISPREAKVFREDYSI